MGWLIAPESIIKPTLAASTRIVFCSNSPLQEAAAAGLERAKAHNFFPIQTKEYTERRDVLVKAFDDLGMKYTLPQGSYFVLLVCRPLLVISLGRLPFFNSQDISNLDMPDDYPFPESLNGRGRDFKYVPQSDKVARSGFVSCSLRACWFMAMELGVSSIPVSEVRPRPWIRTGVLTFPESSTAKNTAASGNRTPASPSARTSIPCAPP